MFNAIDKMYKGRVTHAVITCNTAHHFLPDIEKYIAKKGYGINVLHIAGAAINHIKSEVPNAKHVALMATDGTVSSELYQKHGNNDFNWVLPDKEHQAIGMKSIYEGIKLNLLQQGTEDAARVVDSIVAQFKKNYPEQDPVIVLGCTEFPIALQKEMREARWPNVHFVDTLETLAHSLIENTKIPIAKTRENVAAVGAYIRSVGDLQLD
jgi:aspartate racemase